MSSFPFLFSPFLPLFVPSVLGYHRLFLFCLFFSLPFSSFSSSILSYHRFFLFFSLPSSSFSSCILSYNPSLLRPLLSSSSLDHLFLVIILFFFFPSFHSLFPSFHLFFILILSILSSPLISFFSLYS